MRPYGRIFRLSVAIIFLAVGAEAKETIVLIRHAEKPEAGLGQLDCRGFNRALKLPGVFAATFNAVRPSAIFVPNPSRQKKDKGESFDYVRPLATVEPTAIALGMPVNTQIGFDDTKGLRKELEKKRYRDAFVLVVWEHNAIAKVARKLLEGHGGNPGQVPDWDEKDYDSIYVVTIDWANGKTDFQRKSEGLNGQPDSCPS